MTTAVGALDEAIKEYLVFRGFTSTLKQFEFERKEDKDKGLKVNRIVEHLMQCINRSDFNSLQTFWIYLHKRFFSRLSHDSVMTVYRLETNLLRLFLVYASRQGKQDVVKEFFEKMADALHDKKEWKDWFTFPFTKNPDQHPTFKLYYSKEWGDTFVITLHNFFSTLFACLPLPTLLNFEAEHQKMQALATENHNLHQQLANTKQSLVEAESHVQRLEEKNESLRARMSTQLAQSTSHSSRRTTFSSGTGSKSGKDKASLFGNSPKKPTTKTNSLDNTPHEKSEAVQKQKSEPFNQSSKTIPSQQTPVDIPHSSQSPTATEAEGCVRSYKDEDGNVPFIVVSQEVYKEHTAPITHAKFSPNATRVATVDTDGGLRVWDTNTPSQTFSSVHLSSSLLSLDWAPLSDSILLIGSSDGVVKLFDSSTSKYHWEVRSDNKFPKILSIACSTSSNTFAFSAAAGVGAAHTTGNLATMGLTSPGLPSSRQSVEMKNSSWTSNMGEVGLPPAGGVFIWDLKTQQQKCSLPISPFPVGINCMAFSHNSNLLICGGADGMIRLFDVSQGECLFGWNAHEGEVFNVQFSSDETSVYSMGRDKKFCQWSMLRSGEKKAEFKVHERACDPTAGLKGEYFPSIPPGNLFAFESEDKFVLTCGPAEALIYQVGTDGSLSKTLGISGHNGPVTCVDWLTARRSLSTCLTGSLDKSVKVTNLLKNDIIM